MELLIADDDITSRMMLERTMKKQGFDVVSVPDGEQALSRLCSDAPPRIALLDWLMPSPNGPAICQEVRAAAGKDGEYTYIILLTAKQEMGDIIAGLEAGADDYITKPFNPEELVLRVEAGKRVIKLQDELLRMQAQLRFQADHDPLTGILNRGAIVNRAKQELSRAERDAAPLGLAMLDIDHFKSINDNFGHQVGDAVLRETVTRIQAATRPYDVLGRYGGEEFLLLLPGLQQADVHPLERVLRAVSRTPFAALGGSIPVTISAGLCWYVSGDALEDVVHWADEALYSAKFEGRNRVHCAARSGVKPDQA